MDNHRERWNTGTQAKVQLHKGPTALEGTRMRCLPWATANRGEQSHKKTGRRAFILQSQAGNLCSRTDTELELNILWIKPRIKGRIQLTKWSKPEPKEVTYRNGSINGAGTKSKA